MSEYCKETGIQLHTTAPYTPEQNGVSERKNCTIITRARSMMLHSGLPEHFWFEACSTSNFIGNRVLTSALNNNLTPFEVWKTRKPNISHLRVYGCLAHRVIQKELRDSKYCPVTSSGVLIGFEEDNFNYKVYDLDARKVFIAHDVVFDEFQFPFIHATSILKEPLEFQDKEDPSSRDLAYNP